MQLHEESVPGSDTELKHFAITVAFDLERFTSKYIRNGVDMLNGVFSEINRI